MYLASSATSAKIILNRWAARGDSQARRHNGPHGSPEARGWRRPGLLAADCRSPSFLKYFSSVNIPVYPPLEVTSIGPWAFLRESLQRIPKRRVEYNE